MSCLFACLFLPEIENDTQQYMFVPLFTKLSGVHPQKPPTASYIHRTISRLGLNVVTSTTFPTSYSFDDVTSYLEEAVEWIDELDTERISQEMKKTFYQMSLNLLDRVDELKEDGYPEEIYTGGYDI